jgi:hypothetical protein
VDEVESGAAGTNLAALLAQQLYERWYTRAGEASIGRAGFLAQREHLDRLSEANSGKGTYQPGWTIARAGYDGRLAVEKDDLVYYPPPVLVRAASDEPAPGEPCRVWVPEEVRELQPGFYGAVGDADQADPADLPYQLRLYWHLRATAAPLWVGILTANLNDRGIPFTLKAISSPQQYRRADAGVLFLEPGSYRAARPVLRAAYREVRDELRPGVPRLTAPLAPGLSVAEGPADGSSFGRHRCGLIARGLIAAFASSRGSEPQRRAAVSESFLEAGLDPRRPHLAAGSRSSYRPLPTSDLRRRRGDPVGAPGPAAGGSPGSPWTLAETAARIGDWLCRGAYRSQGRCNWVGGTIGRPDPETGYPMPAVAALHADLYGGTAGIARFLAELYALTGESSHRETAVAAQRQALAAVRGETETYRPLAFYAGRLGVAWTAHRVAELTASPELAAEAVGPLPEGPTSEPRPLDVMDGDAGAILALLSRYRASREGWLIATAIELGRDLLRAVRGDGGARPLVPSLSAPAPGEQPPLAGFAHGAAGLGLALLELAQVTGDDELRRGAEDAFAYEAACFDGERRNWPDLRLRVIPEAPASVVPVYFMTAWCHGAPGIALSRLRAIQVDGTRAADYEATARIGLATTEVRLEEKLAEHDADTGLCHGLAGLIDVLLVGAQVLGEAALRERATAAMQRLVERHARAMSWPTGDLDQVPNPSLFTGLAGIGYTLLRLESPDKTPTLLLPGG